MGRYGEFSYHKYVILEKYNNAISDLYWENVQMYSLQWTWKCMAQKKWFLCSRMELGSVAHATLQDEDHHFLDASLKNRQILCISRHKINDGNFLLAKGIVGRNFSLFSDCFHWIPLIGFHYQKLTFTMGQGARLVAGLGATEEEIKTFREPSLDSWWRMRWYNAVLGFHLHWELRKRVLFEGEAELHISCARHDKHWNMRSLHMCVFSAGVGGILAANLFYACNPQQHFGIRVGWEKWETQRSRLDMHFLDPNGGEDIVRNKRFFNYIWEDIFVGIMYEKKF